MTKTLRTHNVLIAIFLAGGMAASALLADEPPPIPAPVSGPYDDSSNMTWLSQLLPAQLGVFSVPIWDEYSVSDVWGWVSPAGEEYALVGTIEGLAIVRVTDPSNPQFIGRVPSVIGGTGRAWRDVKIYNRPDRDKQRRGHKTHYTGYAYMTTEAIGEGVLIYGLNQLDALPAAPDTSHELTATASWSGGGYEAAHNIYVNQDSGYGYLVGVHLEDGDNACSDADPAFRFNTLVVDLLADPLDPPVVACLPNTGEHDIYVVNYKGPDMDYRHREIAFVFDGRERNPATGNSSTAIGDGGLTEIWDVTNKDNIKVISSFDVPGVCFSHQGWTSKNHEFLLINDEVIDTGSTGWCPNEAPGFSNAGLAVVDITDLDNPVFSQRFELDVFGNAHNFMRVKNRLYWAAYSAGARVLELKRTKSRVRRTVSLELTEVAHMDTEPRDAPYYFGLWGIYAFEKSGTIIGSDVVNGLVVMKMK
jgi:choice-of-anchor B domain-containing protein